MADDASCTPPESSIPVVPLESERAEVKGSVRFIAADSSTPVVAFAKTLIHECMTRPENPINFGPEQLRFLALAVAQLQDAQVNEDLTAMLSAECGNKCTAILGNKLQGVCTAADSTEGASVPI